MKASAGSNGYSDSEGQPRDDRGDQDRTYGPQVEVLQLLDVFDEAGEEIPAPVAFQEGGRQGRQAGVEPRPHSSQQPEGHVVRDEPLEVARERAGDAEKAD